MNAPHAESTVRRGDFPFPLSHSAGESQYLTWIRNHSNYLAVRGMFDYVRILALLVRGALLNLIILFPWMLVVGVLVALRSMAGRWIWDRWTLDRWMWERWIVERWSGGSLPYFFTLIVAGAGLAVVVMSPSVALAHRVFTYRNAQRSGSETTVDYRDRAERFFAALLLALAATFAFESMAAGLSGFDTLVFAGSTNHTTMASAAAALIGIYAFAEPLVRRLGGVARRIAMIGIGAIGILVPLTIVMLVADYVALGRGGGATAVVLAVWAALILLSAVGILVLGIVGGSLRRREQIAISAVITVGVALWFVVVLTCKKEGCGLDADLATKLPVVGIVLIVTMAFCTFAVDINLSSIHGLYRDRLAAAFLIGFDDENNATNEGDLDLGELSRHEAGSRAPYHIINTAINLQGSSSIDLRDRRSDFFIFSKRFIGGQRTGYCRSEVMERVHPSMSLSTAMAISAAAASPNMGRATSPALVALMTLLNIRLGVWVPNPGLLQESVEPTATPAPGGARADRPGTSGDASTPGFRFADVFREELDEVAARWTQLPSGSARGLAGRRTPTVEHGLVGLAFSGGGIRSATVNLGIAQVLHECGVFDHVDYLSTVSGGGYVGSSISAAMRRTVVTESQVHGRVQVTPGSGDRDTVVTVHPENEGGRRLSGGVQPAEDVREYRFRSFARLAVRDGDVVAPGDRLLRKGPSELKDGESYGEVFAWRVPPRALVREVASRLDEKWKWVNVSDGGHIENLAVIELIRRRCKFIIVGDGEADPQHGFNGLATLMRTARIDQGVQIDLDVDPLRLDAVARSTAHWVAGTIRYPATDTAPAEGGYLLYFKSSVTADEDEIIREYRHRSPSFPHESTADQAYTEGQFEAYRSLGQHIANGAVNTYLRPTPKGEHQAPRYAATYAELEPWFRKLVAAKGAVIDEATIPGS